MLQRWSGTRLAALRSPLGRLRGALRGFPDASSPVDEPAASSSQGSTEGSKGFGKGAAGAGGRGSGKGGGKGAEGSQAVDGFRGAPTEPATEGSKGFGKGAAGARGRGFGKGGGKGAEGSQAADGFRGPPKEPVDVKEQVKRHIEKLQDRARSSAMEGMKIWDTTTERDKFHMNWQKGSKVPSRFRIRDPPPKGAPREQRGDEPYTDHAGLRFPTLETAENYDYHKYRGLDRLVDHAFPIKVPGHRRLDPYLREYIHFLHSLDPVRFTIERIAERYRLREKTVRKVCQEWGTNRYLTRSGLTSLKERQQTREGKVLAAKEAHYAKWVGWDQLGDEDDIESDDEKLGDHKGWRSTNDWVRRQNVEVESMSAFPMMAKRDPMPKRVDVDMVVDSRQHVKVINWIDPSDKVAF